MNREELAKLRRVVDGFCGRFFWQPAHTVDRGIGDCADYCDMPDALVYVTEDIDIDGINRDDVTVISDTIERHVGEAIAKVLNAARDLLAAAEECDRLRAELAAVRAAAVEACDLADLISDGVNVSTFDDRIAEIRARIGGGP